MLFPRSVPPVADPPLDPDDPFFALVDVVSRACDPLYTPYLSCRGYMSQSEMWAAGQRIRAAYDAFLETL